MINVFLILLLVSASLIKSLRVLIGVQLNAYRLKPDSNAQSFWEAVLTMIAVIIIAIIAIGSPFVAYIVMIFLLFSAVVYLSFDYGKIRTKFKFTNRGMRLFIAYFVAIATVYSLLCNLIKDVPTKLLLSGLVFILSDFVAIATVLAISPFENFNNKRYIQKATKKLESLNLIKIGITGSFGKTSCKNILYTMLSKKYKCLKTEGSFNTPMGISISVNKLSNEEEVFIAEMGARRKGDIKELCFMIKPNYAIITGVSNQHLESFKTEEAIFNTKKELADFIDADGYIAFNGDNQGTLRMSQMCKSLHSEVYIKEEKDIYAKNIRLSNVGSTFVICGLGDEFSVSTKLLGRHNIVNILLCAALAYKLQVSQKEIKEAIYEIMPIPHRLELVKNGRSITIIDDSYNANVEGVQYAFEVIKEFFGRKVLFTQGIVELGCKQAEANLDLGYKAASIFDTVILTGCNSRSIQEGLEKGGFLGEIHQFKTFEEAKNSLAKLLSAGDVLLIQNDIP